MKNQHVLYGSPAIKQRVSERADYGYGKQTFQTDMISEYTYENIGEVISVCLSIPNPFMDTL